MLGVPLVVVGCLVWFPTIASILLSFTNWNGIGGVGTIQWIGTQNYHQIATIYPPFWPARRAQPRSGSAFLASSRRRSGCSSPYLLDKEIRGTRIYQSVFYLPVVLSLAIIGFIWSSSTRRPRA